MDSPFKVLNLPSIPSDKVGLQLVTHLARAVNHPNLSLHCLLLPGSAAGQTQSLPAPPSVVKVYFFNFLKLQEIEEVIFNIFFLFFYSWSNSLGFIILKFNDLYELSISVLKWMD